MSAILLSMKILVKNEVRSHVSENGETTYVYLSKKNNKKSNAIVKFSPMFDLLVKYIMDTTRIKNIYWVQRQVFEKSGGKLNCVNTINIVQGVSEPLTESTDQFSGDLIKINDVVSSIFLMIKEYVSFISNVNLESKKHIFYAHKGNEYQKPGDYLMPSEFAEELLFSMTSFGEVKNTVIFTENETIKFDIKNTKAVIFANKEIIITRDIEISAINTVEGYIKFFHSDQEDKEFHGKGYYAPGQEEHLQNNIKQLVKVKMYGAYSILSPRGCGPDHYEIFDIDYTAQPLTKNIDLL